MPERCIIPLLARISRGRGSFPSPRPSARGRCPNRAGSQLCPTLQRGRGPQGGLDALEPSSLMSLQAPHVVEGSSRPHLPDALCQLPRAQGQNREGCCGLRLPPTPASPPWPALPWPLVLMTLCLASDRDARHPPGSELTGGV